MGGTTIRCGWICQLGSLTHRRIQLSLTSMKKGYQGDELWSAVNPNTGKRELVDPEGELIPGEMIMKLYYSKRLDGYVTIPGASLFKVAADYTLVSVDR